MEADRNKHRQINKSDDWPTKSGAEQRSTRNTETGQNGRKDDYIPIAAMPYDRLTKDRVIESINMTTCLRSAHANYKPSHFQVQTAIHYTFVIASLEWTHYHKTR